jgi:hypothetical protein
MTQHKKNNLSTRDLRNPKHEAFSRYSAAGLNAPEAYLAAGYPDSGRQIIMTNSARLLRRADICCRIDELKPEYAHVVAEKTAKALKTIEDTIDTSVFERVGRLRALAIRRDSILTVLRAGATFADSQWAPGAETGLVQTSIKAVGKNATVRTHEIDVPILRLLNELERQIAIETGQWEEKTNSKVQFNSLAEAVAAMPTDVLDREIARLEAEQAAKHAAKKTN